MWIWWTLAGIAYNLFGVVINPTDAAGFLTTWKAGSWQLRTWAAFLIGLSIAVWPILLAVTLYRIGLISWYAFQLRRATLKLARLRREEK